MADELAGYELGEVIERDGFVRRQRATVKDDLGRARDVIITRCSAAPGEPIGAIVEAVAEASKGLPESSIVPITKVGRDTSGQPFIVSPAIAGVRLSKRLEQGPIDRAEMLWLAIDLARTIAAAHALTPSLVHGGLRPSAILIDEKGHARIDDYGIGAVLGSIAQQDSTILEITARYHSPEHASSERLPPESDRFSLASVIFEAIAGKPAFVGDSAVGVLMKISMGKPGGVDPNVGPELHALLASCWSKDRKKRPGASSLATSLEALAGGVDPRLPPPKPAPTPSVSSMSLDEEIDPLDVPTLRSAEVPNYVPEVAEARVVERTVRLEDVPFLPVQLPLSAETRPLPRVAPRIAEDAPTMRGETMAIAEILATVGQPVAPEPIEETPIQLEPVKNTEPEVMEFRLLWILVALGAAVTLLLVTILIVILTAF